MEQILIKPLFPQLDQFLADLKPNGATHEFIDGHCYQKPIPQGTTIHLQTQLWDAINTCGSKSNGESVANQNWAIAYPNHRCSFGAWSLVPTLAIFFDPPLQTIAADSPYHAQSSLPPQADPAAFAPMHNRCPDWMIEVITPGYHSLQPLRSALHCLQYGAQMVWLIDPDDHLIFAFWPGETPHEFKRDQVLPVPPAIDLTLTVDQILGWIPAKP